MPWRTQRTLAAWLAVVLLVVAVRQGITGWIGHQHVNVERIHGTPLRFVTDVNHAPWPELTLLPGVGPALAQRIVASREKDGSFTSPEDLLRVTGIGPKTLMAMQPYLDFGNQKSQDE